jgi:hypothetical protein
MSDGSKTTFDSYSVGEKHSQHNNNRRSNDMSGGNSVRRREISIDQLVCLYYFTKLNKLFNYLFYLFILH